MKVFRVELHGQRVELRHGDWGGQRVLVNGAIVSDQPLAGLKNDSHFFDLRDDEGTTHHIEMRLRDLSKLGMGKYVVVVNVDGVERCRLQPIDPDHRSNRCANCGYSLIGAVPENDEVRCPECGRHTPMSMLELPKSTSTEAVDQAEPDLPSDR